MAEGKRGHRSGDVPVFEYTVERATHVLSSALFNACQRGSLQPFQAGSHFCSP